MPLAKIVGALHFLEAADGAVELEPAVAGQIKAARLSIGSGQ
jgi:hypothetical protein